MPISSPRGIACNEAVADASATWDAAQFSMFEDAVAYANELTSDPIIERFDAAPILVIFMNVGLILQFDRRSERYYVTAVIFGSDDSPDPGGISAGRMPCEYLIIEDIFNTLGPSAQNTRINELLYSKEKLKLGEIYSLSDPKRGSGVAADPGRRSVPRIALNALAVDDGEAGEHCEIASRSIRRSGPRGRRFVVKRLDQSDPLNGTVVLEIAPGDWCQRRATPTTS